MKTYKQAMRFVFEEKSKWGSRYAGYRFCSFSLISAIYGVSFDEVTSDYETLRHNLRKGQHHLNDEWYKE